MSLSRIFFFASRSCCTGAKPRRSWLYLCRTVPKNSQPPPPNTSQATTTTAQDSAQALGRGAGVKNQLLVTVWVKIWSRLRNRGEAKVLFSKKGRTQAAEHLTVTDWAGRGEVRAQPSLGLAWGWGTRLEGKQLQTQTLAPTEWIQKKYCMKSLGIFVLS